MDVFDISKAQAVCKAVDLEGWEHVVQPDVDVPPPPIPVNVHCSGHPLLAHKMTILRDVRTAPRDFRRLLREVTFHIGYEATANLLTVPRSDISSPIGPVLNEDDCRIAESVALVPVLRA